MKRLFLAFLVASLIGVAALVWAWPAQMLAPGPLIPAHAETAGLSDRCLACHTPLLGPSAARCAACHVVAEIGLRTVGGAPISRALSLPPFHQGLASSACMECHSDHPGPRLAPHPVPAFAHAMLAPALGADCAGCHAPPQDALHLGAAACGRCHDQADWTARALDHSGYFALTGPHDAPCATCHAGDDLKQFTCYGCHEHEEAEVAREHREEGVRDIANCVACHRSADDEGRERRGEDGDHD